MFLWLGFILCTAVIVYAGTRLSRYGDIIAEKTGLGRTWIGVVLIASVTSLPELVTGISSVTFAGVPDIAAGDILGSCVFNLLILAFLDTLCRKTPLSCRMGQTHMLPAGFSLLLLSLAVLGVFLGGRVPAIGWISVFTIFIAGIYFIAMRKIFVHEKDHTAAKAAAEPILYSKVTLKKALLIFSANALVVVIAAVFLPKIGEGIARSTGLGQTFVGNILIAITTSLPEVVVSIAAVRMGAIDLAVGNIFGSNVFNMFILALDDIFFFRGPLFASVDPNHIISAVCAVIMTSIAVIGLAYRAAKKKFFMAWDSLLITMVYILNILLLYLMKK